LDGDAAIVDADGANKVPGEWRPRVGVDEGREGVADKGFGKVGGIHGGILSRTPPGTERHQSPKGLGLAVLR
jgi:hypothetical protein